MPKNFVSNKDVTVRMFKSDFMESLSKVHPAVPLFVFIPVIAFFIYKSIEFQISLSNILLLIGRFQNILYTDLFFISRLNQNSAKEYILYFMVFITIILWIREDLLCLLR